MVDLPQHLHLISVLHDLGSNSTLYPEYFARRPELTPYLGYYYAVDALSSVVSIDLGNRLFLSLYVCGMPLSLAFLLRSLRRPIWPSLLAVPFAYGDSFAWGFINYCAALPLAFLCCGMAVRAVETGHHRSLWALGLSLGMVAVLLFHLQVFAWLGLAIPWLLWMTKSETRHQCASPTARLRSFLGARRGALVAVLPSLGLLWLWVASRLRHPPEIAPGQPWKSWGPMLSAQNLSFVPFRQNFDEFLPTLSGMLRSGADRVAVIGSFSIAVAAVVWWLCAQWQRRPAPIADCRLVGLAITALTLYFVLPFDIHGVMYYLNTRYAHLAAALIVVSVPILPPHRHRIALTASVALALVCGVVLARGFAAFDRESRPLHELATKLLRRSRTMGLIYDPYSNVVRHPVYLHAGATLARRCGGIANFSFATTPHSPLMYRRGKTPPTFASEWQPHGMQWSEHGSYYDYTLLRGAQPRQVFGTRLGKELRVVAHNADFWLIERQPLITTRLR